MGVDAVGAAPAQPLKAALWMTGTIASFSAMAVAGREVSADLDTFETMMYRSFVGLLIVVAVVTLTGRWREISGRLLHIHAVRNVFHFTGQNLWFYAVTVIPLAQVFALEFTTPIWVILVAPVLLGERLTRIRATAAALGFVGILIVARPGFAEMNIGVLAAASAALGFAGSIVFTKFLTRSVPISCILFWLTAMQSVLGIVTAGWDGDVAIPGLAALPYVLVIGLGGLLAHLCLTNALAIAPATIVVPLDFLRLPLIAIVGMALYGEALDIYVFVGAAVIFAANYLNIWIETRPQPRS